jgi:hypothetical protein
MKAMSKYLVRVLLHAGGNVSQRVVNMGPTHIDHPLTSPLLKQLSVVDMNIEGVVQFLVMVMYKR